MARKVRNGFQEVEEEPVVEHYEKQWNDRLKLRGDRFIIATHPRSRLNKASPHFSRFFFFFFSEKLLGHPRLLFSLPL